jgi:4-methylaminobutanoate oxidase (formaldehyde-forming)
MRRIAVVGGGVTGCSVAWHLISRGLGDVHLFERDRVGSGTTWHSAGLVSWGPWGDYDAPVLYLHDLIAQLEQETGLNSGRRITGRLYLARDAEGLERYARFHDEARARGIDARFLTPKEAEGYNPLLTGPALFGACYNPLSGRVNPAGLVELYTRSGKAGGLNIHEQTGIRALAIKSGRIDGVVTAGGETLPFDDVIVCAGIWSADLVVPQDIVLAQGACEHMYIILDSPERLPPETPAFLSSTDLIYGREEVGGILLGCFDTDATVIDVDDLPDPFAFALLNDNWDKFLSYLEAAAEFFPSFREAPVRSFINGPEAFTPDGNPFIGPAEGIEGLWLCTGMNSHGVTISAGTGHVVADLLAGVDPRFAINHYAPGRFDEMARDSNWLRQQIADSPSGNF